MVISVNNRYYGMAQSVQWPTLDYCPDHDLRVERSSPGKGSVLGAESVYILSPSPSFPPLKNNNGYYYCYFSLKSREYDFSF